MLRLRVICGSDRTEEVQRVLDETVGVAHISVLRGASVQPPGDIVEALLARECADEVLDSLTALSLQRHGAIMLAPCGSRGLPSVARPVELLMMRDVLVPPRPRPATAAAWSFRQSDILSAQADRRRRWAVCSNQATGSMSMSFGTSRTPSTNRSRALVDMDRSVHRTRTGRCCCGTAL